MNIVEIVKEIPGLADKLSHLGRDPLAPTPILFVKIKLLWQCNLSCIFCERRRSHTIMSKRQVVDILDFLLKQGLKKVHFSGGEVFLHPEITDILRYSRRIGLQVNLTTNGTLVTKDMARRLTETGVHSISVSLDSCYPEIHDRLRGAKGAFKKTVKTLHHLIKYRDKQKKKKIILRVNTVLCRDNVEHLEGIHELLVQMHPEIIWKLLPVDAYMDKGLRVDKFKAGQFMKQVPQWPLLKDIPMARAGKNPHKALSKGHYAGDYYRYHPCYMPWFHLFIDPEGFVYPCCMTRTRLPALGKLPEQTLEDILKGEKRNRLHMTLAAGEVMTICHTCDDFLEENAELYRLLHPREVDKNKK